MSKITELDEIVRIAKQLYLDLGRTPLSLELVNAGITRHTLTKIGGYQRILDLAGLPSLGKAEMMAARKAPIKITKEIYTRDIDSHLDDFKPKYEPTLPKYPKILCVGDIHFPYVHKQALEEVYAFAEIHKPDYIIQMGDSVDFYSHSKFPRSHNEFTPKQEEQMARDMLTEFWSKLHNISPDAKKYQILGNHCARPLKRVIEELPTIEHWVTGYFESYFTFDNVTTIFDHRDELIIEDIVFTHGFLGKEGTHRDYYLRNTVIGHLHKGWVQYRRFHNKVCWELCAGFLGDPMAKGLTYTPSKAANYQLGFGYIDQYGPRFIAL